MSMKKFCDWIAYFCACNILIDLMMIMMGYKFECVDVWDVSCNDVGYGDDGIVHVWHILDWLS